MNIAIIGGGFYGSHLAKKISKLGCSIDLYEKNKDILQEAINNNQHRLHLGFHYPRCSFTIEQSKRSYTKFINEYNFCVDDIKDNFYIIDKNSNVNFSSYKEIYKEHNLFFEEIDKKSLDNFFVNPCKIEGIIKVKEKKINLLKLTSKLREEIYTNKNINLKLNTNIEQITDETEIIYSGHRKKYDYIINATYSKPSLGLSPDAIQTKNELCFLLLVTIEDEKFFDKAFTIMDGQYVSLYPADYKNTYTISSVTYTPFLKGDEINLYKKNAFNIIKQSSENIYKHFLDFINIKNDKIKFIKNYVSYKTKILHDSNDFRGSFYLKNNKNISLMCGKISAILDLEENIINELK